MFVGERDDANESVGGKCAGVVGVADGEIVPRKDRSANNFIERCALLLEY